jgi:hypothetical protein
MDPKSGLKPQFRLHRLHRLGKRESQNDPKETPKKGDDLPCFWFFFSSSVLLQVYLAVCVGNNLVSICSSNHNIHLPSCS